MLSRRDWLKAVAFGLAGCTAPPDRLLLPDANFDEPIEPGPLEPEHVCATLEVEATDALVSWADPDFLNGRPALEVIFEQQMYLHQVVGTLAAERRENPGDDLISSLVHAEVEGDRLTDAEVAAFFVLLSVAGNDTTRQTISHTMKALTDFPDQRAWLLEDYENRIGTAVEEFVRWATPVMTFRRTTTRDVELHGVTIPAGEKVVLFYHSGNRDETAFEDPWRFDVTRDPNRHLGFGGGGPHFCMGASLARTQLAALFGELYRQVPDIEAGEPERYRGGAFIHGIKRMPAEWTAA